VKQCILTRINRGQPRGCPTYIKEKKMLIPKRGDMFVADLGQGTGSEQANERPVVVVQNNKGNSYADTTIIVPITSRMKNDIPNHVIIHYGILKKYKGCVLTEQVRTISIYRLKKYIGTLSEKDIRRIEKAMKISLAINNNKKVK
jgi:mRNA interferase MazF